MQIDILNLQGQKTGATVELPSEVFDIEPNDHLIYMSVKQYLAAQRTGNHKVKTRAEVKGASRKLHKQKGTGGSRKGNIRNPLYKGGGTIFGPKPHAYDIKVNKKEKEVAKYSALTYKAKNNSVLVVDNLVVDAPKTKEMASFIQKLELPRRRVLLITNGLQSKVFLSSRNIPFVEVLPASDINVYSLMKADFLIFDQSVLSQLN